MTGFSYALLVLKNNENCTYWHCPWIWLFTMLGILKYVCSLLNRNCFFVGLWIECVCYTQSPEKWWPPYFVDFALFLKPSLLLSCAPPGHHLGQSPIRNEGQLFLSCLYGCCFHGKYGPLPGLGKHARIPWPQPLLSLLFGFASLLVCNSRAYYLCMH